jgi:hypothetical protein
VTRSDSRETLLCWLDSQGDAWVEVTCPHHALVAGLNLAAVKPNIGDHRFEESRRAMLHHAFRLAGRVEGATCPGVLVPSPQSPLDDYRLEPGAEIKTLPDVVRAWWEVNRGWIRVKCSLHGVLVRTDTTRTPAMLAPLWDGAVIEQGTQKEHVWSNTPEDAWRVAEQGPTSTICDVSIESERNPLATFPVVPQQRWWPYGLA